MSNTISNQASPRFEIKFNESTIEIQQEEKANHFFYNEITRISIKRGGINWLPAIVTNLISIIILQGSVEQITKKDNQLEITTKSNTTHKYSLRYLEHKGQEELRKLINEFSSKLKRSEI